MKYRVCTALGVSLLAIAGCQRTAAPPAPGPRVAAKPAAVMDRERLLKADSEPQNWPTAGRDFGKSHHSPLDQINAQTVGRLGFAWQTTINNNRGLETTPIVIDGVLYTSGQEGRVYALDAATGAEIWHFLPTIDGQVNRKVCCDAVNRGVAVWQGRVYVTALDGVMYALDAATGKIAWQADTVIDHERGYTSTGAPEIAGKVVVIGNAGGEYDARGYVSAYDLDSGALAWRFFVVPGDPRKPFEHSELEMAAKTWDPNSRWDVGLGGTPWDALVYDPELDLLYVGTGNAALYPQKLRSPRGGDNLFLTSILAIKPGNGHLAWYYQETPGDQWDYTATAPIILADLKIDGVNRKVLMQAPKNGLFYVLDRETGKFISAKPFAPINWLKSLDPQTGKATVDRDAVDYNTGPKLVFPSGNGAHSWTPMAFNPQTGLVYLSVTEVGNYMVVPSDPFKYQPGDRNRLTIGIRAGDGTAIDGGSIAPADRALIESKALEKGQPSTQQRSFLGAWNPATHSFVWKVEASSWRDRAGVLSTAANLIVQGTITGKLRVFDASSGAVLKELDVGSSIIGAPMTYAIGGKQYIAVMAGLGGGGQGAFDPPHDTAAYKYGNQGRILAFTLDGGVPPKPAELPPVSPIPEPPSLASVGATPQRLAAGASLFAEYCTRCHGNSNGRGATPDLRRLPPEMHQLFPRILLEGLFRSRGMPQWNDILSEEDVASLHAFVVARSWEAYRREKAGSASGYAPAARSDH
jgi:quinohemoprotein ethanol dehydrogenase